MYDFRYLFDITVQVQNTQHGNICSVRLRFGQCYTLFKLVVGQIWICDVWWRSGLVEKKRRDEKERLDEDKDKEGGKCDEKGDKEWKEKTVEGKQGRVNQSLKLKEAALPLSLPAW